MPRRTLDELMARATAELHTNPTIWVYEITPDGFEIRRPAYPFAGLAASLDKAMDGFRRVGDQIAAIAARMSDWKPGDPA